MTQTLPAASCFLAEVHGGRAQTGRPLFSTLGTPAHLRDEISGNVLHTTLLHAGAPEGAHARAAGCAVVFAGELYNEAELRSVLPVGSEPDSDAHLLLALFARYDIHAFRLLNGRFAALVHTGERVVLATDHAGSVPLYLTAQPGRLVAATEAKALRGRAGGVPITQARPVRRLPGVHQVPAGTALEVRLATAVFAAHRTWMPPLGRRILPQEEATESVRTALQRAVEARLGPLPPLVVLSGGIDSSSVAALAAARTPVPIDTVSMGTDEADEFPQARIVAEHLRTAHREVTVPIRDLLRRLPHTVWAAETLNPDIIEYLLPLTALYLRLEEPGRRILTGYGADIPLGGMHREDRLPALDAALAIDMDTFDGLNEMSPVLSGIGGHWSTHPYWDREVLDLLVSLEAGLKRRHGQDKWVLRAAMSELLPLQTVIRPKLGVHEGSGTSSSFSRMLIDAGIPEEQVQETKRLVVCELFDQVVAGGRHPDEVAVDGVLQQVVDRQTAGTSLR